MTTRREFVKRASLGAAALTVPAAGLEAAERRAPAFLSGRAPAVAIASANGLEAVREALTALGEDADSLEAAVRGVNIVELNPLDMSVGYGGLPNELGVVQLDASVMHGPSRGAGAVGALEGVRTPSKVAADVMRWTDHVMLVGEGAQRFARQMGYEIEETLLTEASRRRWLEWRTGISPDDDWLSAEQSGYPPPSPPRDARGAYRDDPELAALDSHDGVRPMGTINCDVLAPDGSLSGVTTTSGLFFKVPGRVGDSPIIGAGLYVDNDVGAAGSTGRGEAVIKTVGSHTVVEAMRQGMSPTDACFEALRRIVRWTVEGRLLRGDGRPDFNVNYYAVSRTGEFGAAALWEGSRYAVNVDGDASIRDSAFLFERAG